MIRRLLTGFSIGLAVLAATPSLCEAALVNGTSNTGHGHNIGGGAVSPFYTQATHSSGSPTYTFGAAGGLFGSIASASADSSPVVLTTANNNTGNGLGIGNPTDTYQGLDPGEILTFSAASISGVSYSGTLVETPFTFAPGTVDGVGFVGFRSANFPEASRSTVLSNGTDTVGFGQATGTLASNVAMDNNTAPTFAAFDMSVPLTLTNNPGGGYHLKGFTLQHSFSYDIVAVPEPSSAMALLLVGIGGIARRCRRVV